MKGRGQIRVTRKSDGQVFPLTPAEKAHYLNVLAVISGLNLPLNELHGRAAGILFLRKVCEAVADRKAEWYSFLFMESPPEYLGAIFIKQAGEEIAYLSKR